MTDAPTQPPRRSWATFSLRTLLVLTLLAALASWWARREMLREQRRRELFDTFDKRSEDLDDFLMWQQGRRGDPSWRARIGAWLGGVELVGPVSHLPIPKGTTEREMQDVVGLFPEVDSVSIHASDTTPASLAPWADARALNTFHVRDSLRPEADTFAALGRIRTTGGKKLLVDPLDDQAMTAMADAKVDPYDLFHGMRPPKFGDEGLAAAASFSKLEMIVAGRKGSDVGWERFRGHTTVRSVRLIGRGYTDSTADVTAGLRSLLELEIDDTSHTDEGLAKAVSALSLKFLSLRRVDVGLKTRAALAGLPSLKRLALRDVDLTPNQCGQFARLSFTDPSISGDAWDDERVARLAPLAARLKSFRIDDAPRVTDAGLAWLRGAVNLNELELHDTQTTAAVWDALPNPGVLDRAAIGGPHVDAAMLATTIKMTSLTTISLRGPSIDDAILIAPRNAAADLQLWNANVTADGLKAEANRAAGGRIVLINDKKTPAQVSAEQLEEIAKLAGGARVHVITIEPVSFDEGKPE